MGVMSMRDMVLLVIEMERDEVGNVIRFVD